MPRTVLTSLAVAVVALVSLSAQNRPDFSGKWVTEFLRTTNGDASLGLELTIAQTADALTVKYTTVGTTPLPRNLSFKLDGSPSKNTIATQAGPAEQVSTTTWKGGALTITTGDTSNEQTLTLTLDNGTLVVSARSKSETAPRKVVYKKAG